MNCVPETVDAIALYGSAVRTDFDRYSDRDVLLVSDDNDALFQTKAALTEEGYSCSCYSWGKLDLLAAKKALFIQHLKQESQIVLDRDNRLLSFLAGYSPASSYSDQIQLTRSLIALTENFVDTQKGIGWALDVLAVGLRNLAILTLANEGKYIFALPGLLSELKKMGQISSEHECRLMELRRFKSHFRHKRYHLLPTREVVFGLQKIIGQSFDVAFEPMVMSREAFQYACLHSKKAREMTNWYAQARLCEGAFMTLDKSIVSRSSSMWSRLQRIEDAIENPSCYNFLFANCARDLREDLANLIDVVNLKAA
ncbi:MAG: hypothetical protein QOJ64_3299 [Acidobacteriota bacterium]|jgi:predicted nucleotidyltransferase|nr:hypothetical protein [Acidobacteriota bacterium]